MRSPSTQLALLTGGALLCMALTAMWQMQGLGDRVDAAGPAAAPVGTAACSRDLACTVARVLPEARLLCSAAVEQLAAFGVQWDDVEKGGPRFERPAWLDESQGTLSLAGNRASFANGAGSYRRVEYECDYDPANHRVLDVRARPARLPGLT